MKYQITVTLNPDELLTIYCENNGLDIKDCDLDVESILEGEVTGWLDASGVYVLNVEEVQE